MVNFELNNIGEVSQKFKNLGINDFKTACVHIAKLPYRRNRVKSNISCALEENAGTCSTKHTVLRKLALENDHPEVKLMLEFLRWMRITLLKLQKH